MKNPAVNNAVASDVALDQIENNRIRLSSFSTCSDDAETSMLGTAE
jgi:hypothetical protein